MDATECNRRLVDVKRQIQGKDKALAAPRAEIASLHARHKTLERSKLDLIFARQAIPATLRDEIESTEAAIAAAESATLQDEEACAALRRQEAAHKRYLDMVKPEHVERVRGAQGHAWRWKQ